jgi:hypothetical protein
MQVGGIRVGGGKLCAGAAVRDVFVNFSSRMTNGLLQKYNSVQSSCGKGEIIWDNFSRALFALSYVPKLYGA